LWRSPRPPRFQADTLAKAANVDQYAGTAAEVLKRARIIAERAVTVASGSDPTTAHKTVGTVLSDVIAVGGGASTTTEGRIVLVTGQKVRLFDGRHLSNRPECLLGTYNVGAGVLAQENEWITFPDGHVVEFATSAEATRVRDAAEQSAR
jgi:hypothetical protein